MSVDVETDPAYAHWRARLVDPKVAITDQPSPGFYRHRFGGAVAVWRGKSGLRIQNTFYSRTAQRVETLGALWDEEHQELIPWPLILETERMRDQQKRVIDMWIDSAKNPVSQDAYSKAVADPLVKWPEVNQTVAEVDAGEEDNSFAGRKARLLKLLGEAAKVGTITSEEQLSQVESLRKSIGKLRLDLDKERESRNAPHQAAIKENNGLYKPLVEKGEAGERMLKGLQETWLTEKAREEARKRAEAERQRLAEEAAEAERLRKAAEPLPAEDPDALPADVRAHNAPPADDDNPLGLPPLAPPREEPPAIVAAPFGNSLGQVKAAGGRASSAKIVNELDAITDLQAVFAFFQNNPAVRDLLTKLADRAIRDGFEVPGTTKRDVVKLRG